MPFAGGELEGPVPKSLCDTCRQSVRDVRRQGQVLCFRCCQADRERERAIRAASERETGSEARFQIQLPFEPVNRPRLDYLRAERSVARIEASRPAQHFELRRRQAQIAARRALDQAGWSIRGRGRVTPEETRVFAAAIHAAELQLPDAWLPFVAAR
jgi:hypothetical protein